MYVLLRCFAILLLSYGLASCAKEKPPEQKSTSLTKPQKIPSLSLTFSADSAFLYVQKQVDFGPRVPNTAAHQECGNFLVDQLQRHCDTVLIQEFQTRAFDKTLIHGRNIIGELQPEKKKRILLAAHWDTRPFANQDKNNSQEPILGANDGASGVAVLLEIARQIKQNTLKPEIGIDIIFFDAEDYGVPSFIRRKTNQNSTFCLGSQYWAKNKHKKNYSAYFGILLDMVGGKNAVFAWEGYSRKFCPKILKMVWQTGQAIGFEKFFINQPVSSITDDHYFITKFGQIPTIDIIQTDVNKKRLFFEQWHTHGDNLSIIDKNTLKAVGQTVLTVLYNEN